MRFLRLMFLKDVKWQANFGEEIDKKNLLNKECSKLDCPIWMAEAVFKGFDHVS